MSFPSCDRTVMLAAKEDSEEIDTPVIRRIWCAYRQKTGRWKLHRSSLPSGYVLKTAAL